MTDSSAELARSMKLALSVLQNDSDIKTKATCLKDLEFLKEFDLESGLSPIKVKDILLKIENGPINSIKTQVNLNFLLEWIEKMKQEEDLEIISKCKAIDKKSLEKTWNHFKKQLSREERREAEKEMRRVRKKRSDEPNPQISRMSWKPPSPISSTPGRYGYEGSYFINIFPQKPKEENVEQGVIYAEVKPKGFRKFMRKCIRLLGGQKRSHHSSPNTRVKYLELFCESMEEASFKIYCKDPNENDNGVIYIQKEKLIESSSYFKSMWCNEQFMEAQASEYVWNIPLNLAREICRFSYCLPMENDFDHLGQINYVQAVDLYKLSIYFGIDNLKNLIINYIRESSDEKGLLLALYLAKMVNIREQKLLITFALNNQQRDYVYQAITEYNQCFAGEKVSLYLGSLLMIRLITEPTRKNIERENWIRNQLIR